MFSIVVDIRLKDGTQQSASNKDNRYFLWSSKVIFPVLICHLRAMVASSPEVVCRVLHRFQADGILEVTRAHITWQDRAALMRLVDVD